MDKWKKYREMQVEFNNMPKLAQEAFRNGWTNIELEPKDYTSHQECGCGTTYSAGWYGFSSHGVWPYGRSFICNLEGQKLETAVVGGYSC